MPCTYKVIKSHRKTYSLEVKNSGEIIVRVPVGTTKSQVEKFVANNKKWIEKSLSKVSQRAKKVNELPALTYEDLTKLIQLALEILPQKVKYFSNLIGVTYGKITIRNQKSRWGSCSSKGNLNFNCLLMLTPDDVQDYIVVHELCHRKQMNHSKNFWAEVEKILPDYKVSKKWLKENGGILIERMLKSD